MTTAARRIRLLMELRRNGITDTRTLSAIEKIPREDFIPANFLDKAYENTALPIGQGQTISQPYVVAMMTQALALQPRDLVLEIGTGSGYQCCILSHLARRIYTIERHKDLQDQAVKRFEELKLRNITHRCGDGYKGWPEAAPFDKIIVTASASDQVPQDLMDQLSPDGGIMVIPVRVNAVKERLFKITRQGDEITTDEMMDVRFVPFVSERDLYDAQRDQHQEPI